MGAGGGESGPQRLLTGKFSADLLGKKRQWKQFKRGKMEKKRRKIVEGKVENWKWKEAKLLKWGPFFLSLSSLFKMTKNCFGKSISCRGKKSGKMTLPHRKKFPVTPLNGSPPQNNFPVTSLNGSHQNCATKH